MQPQIIVMKELRNLVNAEELKARMRATDEVRTTLSFYRYAHIAEPQQFRDRLFAAWSELGVLGRIYVATEGINGQLSLPTVNLDAFRAQLYAIPFLDGVRLNVAIDDDGKSFFKLMIKVRPKIVADGLNDASFDVTDGGTHVDAATFNALTDDPETVVVDMRNHYESEVGHFENAITPDVETFRESLPIIADDILADAKTKKVVMYCTGGIRCEKASAYLKHRGFQNVFQLDGGIIEYARQVKAQALPNKFRGKNFVFDERLGERISEEVIANCHQCGAPCDTHVDCANTACHLLFIQCPTCAARYQHCCSDECAEFIQLPPEKRSRQLATRTFNGQRFGKGRFKALGRTDSLRDDSAPR